MSVTIDQTSPFFVAEISANHQGQLSMAHKLVEAASEAGANAVKFQTYTADTMTLDLENFKISSDHKLWGNRKLYELYDEAHTPWDWHYELFSHARELGLIPFSTPFDISAVDFLEKLNCSIYKIASLETGDLDLIEAVGKTGKPCFLSTGATNFDEVEEAVNCFLSTGNSALTLLVCTSSYPANPKDAHVSRINLLKEKFNLKIGISDHTLGIGASLAAIALGANVIEKHLTINRNDGGLDSQFSMEPAEFKFMVEQGKIAHSSLGNPEWNFLESERESRKLRRSLYVVKNVQKGESITKDNVRAIRPGEGANPKIFKSILGKRFNRDLEIGTPMNAAFVDD